MQKNKFQKKIKKAVLFLTAFCVSFGVWIGAGGQGTVYAEDPLTEDDYSTIDELGEYNEDQSLVFDSVNNRITFITDDARRTSPIYYHTVGFFFYRCYPGTKEADPDTFIVIKLDDPDKEKYYDTPSGKQRVRAYWYFDAGEIEQAISAVSQEWYEEITKKDQDIYFKADGIMQVCFDWDRDGIPEKRSGELYNGRNFIYAMKYGPETERYKGESYKGSIYAYGKLYYSKEELRQAQPWGSGTSGMGSHFNKYIKFVPKTVEPEPEEKGDVIEYDVKPEWKTWNRSTTGEYDLSEGIPSSESITNYVKTDAWYGFYKSINRTVTKIYPVHYRITYNFKIESRYMNYVTGKEEVTYYDSSVTAYKMENIERIATYNFIPQIYIYQFDNATVYNDAFPDGHATYESKKEVPITAIVKGIDITQTDGMGTTAGDAWDDDAHIIWPDQYSGTVDITIDSGAVMGMADAQAAAEGVNVRGDAEKRIGAVYAHNDTLIIDGVTYLDGTECSAPRHVTCPGGSHLPDDFPEEYEEGIGYDMTPYSQDLVIPPETRNGEYPTKMTVHYKPIAPGIGGTWIRDMEFSCVPSDPNHIVDEGKPEQETQEPVIVHTPVISPVSVGHDGREDVQLINPDLDVQYQFLLDGTYTFKFDPAKHKEIQGYGWSGDPSKYDKYVKMKEVCFPFEVRIGSDYYEPGEWIEVENETTFYIPPWAIEDVYTILFRVTAINDDGTGGYEDTANIMLENHVATYEITCQVSGRIYDFQVTGLNDKDMFGGFEKEYSASQYYSFVENDEAKRVGSNNRLGESYIRLADGTVLNYWNTSNILPLSNGKSNTLTGMGTLRCGTTFCFTVKTMANLWHENDSIYITPTYRYIDKNGNLLDDVKIYYYENAKYCFVEVGGTIDAKLIHLSEDIGDKRFKCAFKDEDLRYTVSKMVTEDMANPLYYFTYKEVEMFNQSYIEIPSSMRLFIGCEEELEMNLRKNRTDIGKLLLPEGKEDNFHMSMQQWFGTFQIPMDFYVCDADIDLDEYALTSEEGLSEYSSIWKDGGYLILNFDIISKKEGADHLSYINLENNIAYGHCNMWRREGGATTATLDGPTLDTYLTVDLKDGDVAAIFADRHLYDKYQPSTVFID